MENMFCAVFTTAAAIRHHAPLFDLF